MNAIIIWKSDIRNTSNFFMHNIGVLVHLILPQRGKGHYSFSSNLEGHLKITVWQKKIHISTALVKLSEKLRILEQGPLSIYHISFILKVILQPRCLKNYLDNALVSLAESQWYEKKNASYNQQYLTFNKTQKQFCEYPRPTTHTSFPCLQRTYKLTLVPILKISLDSRERSRRSGSSSQPQSLTAWRKWN
jgi:hypothetical protein